MTSNLGSSMMLDAGAAAAAAAEGESGRAALRELVMGAVRSHFRPEFGARGASAPRCAPPAAAVRAALLLPLSLRNAAGKC